MCGFEFRLDGTLMLAGITLPDIGGGRYYLCPRRSAVQRSGMMDGSFAAGRRCDGRKPTCISEGVGRRHSRTFLVPSPAPLAEGKFVSLYQNFPPNVEGPVVVDDGS